MILEWSLTLGNLLTVVGFCVSGIAFVFWMRSDLMVLANRVSNLEGATRELVQANLALAEQKGHIEQLDQRFNYLSERVDSLIDAALNKTNP